MVRIEIFFGRGFVVGSVSESALKLLSLAFEGTIYSFFLPVGKSKSLIVWVSRVCVYTLIHIS
jgi:hypothetical protein